MYPEYPEVIERAVRMAARARSDAIETMCERMLTDPWGWGVMHDRNAVWLDPRVPFGNIWDVSACGSEAVRA